MLNGEYLEVKFIHNKIKFPCRIEKRGNRLWLSYPFNKAFTDELKTMLEGMKWHGFEDPPIKQWSCLDSQHNWWQFSFLSGQNPYALYQAPLYLVKPSREICREHQIEMTSVMLTRHYCIIAAEMGTGKTLSSIEAMEMSGHDDWLYVAPKTVLNAIKLELQKWNAKVHPTLLNYEALKKHVAEWPSGKKVYQGVIFDEGSRLKNPTAQRTEAAQHIADAIRNEWGDQGYVILMSGTPAPKSPLDWYSLCRVVRPGYLKEGSQYHFKNRLGIIAEKENTTTGGVFPQLVSWRDDENKCHVCGEDKKHSNHDARYADFHPFKASVNEVVKLHKRMAGLTVVKFKKDCSDLPDKVYEVRHCTPSPEQKKAAKLILARATSTIKALTLLRELSDGFQYKEIPLGKETCPTCKGRRTIVQKVYTGPDVDETFCSRYEDLKEQWELFEGDASFVHVDPAIYQQFYTDEDTSCPECKGSGEVLTYTRETNSFKTPKDDEIINLLDEHDDIGRLVIYAGFTGSIERCIATVQSRGWDYIRMDRIIQSSLPYTDGADLLRAFQQDLIKHDKVAFIGHPGSAGMGITLTASPTTVFFSNDFNAESRIQAEDRIHRLGMDVNRGARIIDLFCLETDEYVLQNLRRKRDLQAMSLGELKNVAKLLQCADDPVV